MPFARARIIWVIVAALAWQFAVVNESRGMARESLPALLLVMTSFAVGLGAIVVALSDRAQKWLEGWRLFGVLTFFFVAYGVVDFAARARSPYTFTTDAHVYMDYAARLVSAGKNPYDTSLYGAIVSTRSPIELQTPLDNGGLSDRLAYPSLSVLFLVPFVKLGIPTTIAYALALYGCLAIIFHVTPKDLRPLVLLPFFADESYVAFCFGGITDTVWALLLCLVVVTWRRPRLAAIFFGLACSYKQHPWLLAPLLAVRIAREVPRERRWATMGRFFGTAAAVFVALNLPFALWSPKVWLLGVVEPLATSMVPMGEGVSGLLVFAGAAVPKPFFSVAFWGLYAVLIVVSATWRSGRVFLWIAPSVAFFLNYRSLSTYWYFNLLPLVAELAVWHGEGAADTPAPASPPLFQLSWRGARPALAVVALLLVGGGAYASLRRNASVEVVVEEPMRAWSNYVFRVDLRLTNSGGTTLTPRFWIQGSNFQPLPWLASGPPELAPGASASYSISAIARVSQFDIARGARLTVTDLSSSLRKSVQIAPDDAELSPLAVPNASFRFWDVTKGAPTYWVPSEKGSPGASVSPVKNEAHRAVELTLEPDAKKRERELIEFCGAVVSCYAAKGSSGRFVASDLEEKDHRIEIAAELALHPGKLMIWADTPKDANLGADPEDRYGVELWIGGRAVTLLLGGEARKGTLANGLPFEVLPGPRGGWTRYTIDLDDLQRRFAPNVYPRVGTLKRFPYIDIPMVSLRVVLFYASTEAVVKSARFGEIEEDMHGKDRIEDVIAMMDAHPGAIDAWRARYEADLKNPTRSRQYLERARRNETHPELELQAAFQHLGVGQAAEAEQIFRQLVTVEPVQAHLGWGVAAMQQQRYAEALPQFQLALDALARATSGRALEGDEELQKLGAMLGLADAQALVGDCEGSRRTFDSVPRSERDAHLRAAPKPVPCEAR